ncbi:flavin reductase family protein [Nonomuraea dietziae]|uniref:flavin reductase family protein n=1 Tax=Nonomuraea dietziae TaxID=65515 RepID=UPI0031D7148D
MNVLGQRARTSCRAGSPPRRRTSSRGWRPARPAGGLPVLEGTLASFACRTVTVHEGGDHLIFVGAVEQFDRTCGEPLVFHSGRYLERVAG